jgi:FlaA1/EpsC-like NDP-sugar epimerase
MLRLDAKLSTENIQRNGGSTVWWARFLTRQVQYTLDLIILVEAFVLAYLLRFDFIIPDRDFNRGLVQLPYVVLVQFLCLKSARIYTFIWRYIGMAEIKPFFKAAVWSCLPIFAVRLGLPDTFASVRVPLSVIVIDTIIAFGLVFGIRVLRRALYERYEKKQRAIKQDAALSKPILLVGAGRAGVTTAKEILGRGDINLEIRGFVDDDSSKVGSIIQGIKVLGTCEDLPRLVKERRIDHVVISVAQATRQEFRRILGICESIPVKVKVIPGLYEILQGNVQVSRIRDLQIEDLLGRDPVQIDVDDIKAFLAGKRIMITGAGGSIGSELARQVARFEPSKLLLVERAEFALFNIDHELRESNPELSTAPLLADVGDEGRLRNLFSSYRPQIIIHAAAHKHVPMMEFSPTEAVKNNVIATKLIGELAGEFGAEVFVLISTDKAVRPRSVMGASKRVAEVVVQDFNNRYKTNYIAVRFGNVIGSAGSVIPIFRDQIRKGGPVTVTDPRMVRYFMTIPEAAQLVLQAGAIGKGSEIFVLDMGEPVNILDLAKDIITLSGLKPFEDIDIVFTGMRPGEKLFEELEMDEEQLVRTRHPKIFVGKIAAYDSETVRLALERLTAFSREENDAELRNVLNQFLPEAELGPAEGPATGRAVRLPIATEGGAAVALQEG